MNAKQSSVKDFEMLSKLGEGAFGVVWKVRRKEDGKEYAMKKVKLGAMKEKERENAVNEIRILASLNGDYIIGYKDAFYDEPTSTLNVVMEFASGGDILKRINEHTKKRTRFSEDEIWKALVHMTKGKLSGNSGLKSLHDCKILHRDLKCANVFIDSEGVYKLGDLNVSKVLKQGLAHTQTGTPYYASPEVWQDLPYDMKSDMWSLGCVIYEMAALRPPFQATDLQGLFRKVKAGVFERIPTAYSNDLAVVIGMLLKVNPTLRPSADQLLANSIVQKHFKGEIGASNGDEVRSELLETIKFNPKNLVALKNKLPKANYIKEQIEEEPVKAPQPPKPQPEPELKKVDSRSELEKKNRERVLSACGIRPPAYCESPRIAVHKQDDVGKKLEDPYKKMMEMNNPKLPPKPQPAQQPLFKLPPKPQANYNPPPPARPSSNHSGNVNRSYDDVRSQSRQKVQPPQVNTPVISRSKDNLHSGNPGSNRQLPPSSSRENLGKKPPLQQQVRQPMPRPSSAQRVQVHPSWWG